MSSYRREVKLWLDGKRCVVTGRPATECHHVRGRAGALLLDKRHWLPVSREAHDWIHRNPSDAAAKGWLAGKGEWGRSEP